MVEERVERIVIKKLHLKNVAMFSLFKGLIVGILLALILLGFYFINPGLLAKLPGALKVVDTAGAFVLAFLIFMVYTVISVVMGVFMALVYNLASKMGGAIHFGLMEAEVKLP